MFDFESTNGSTVITYTSQNKTKPKKYNKNTVQFWDFVAIERYISVT